MTSPDPNPSIATQPALITMPEHLRPIVDVPEVNDTFRLAELPDFQRQDDANLHHTVGNVALNLDADSTERYGDDTVSMTERTVKGGVDQITHTLEISQNPEDSNTKEILEYMPIKSGISIDGQDFYLSDSVTAGDRKYCVGYVVLASGQVAPRFFYKSSSQGEWRVAPFTITINTKDNKVVRGYSKGETMDFGYARETQLHSDLNLALKKKEANAREWKPQSIDWLSDHFNADKLGSTNTYQDEAFETRLTAVSAEVFTLRPGNGFISPDGRPAREIMSKASIASVQSPDFRRNPVKITKSEHPLLGSVTTERYMNRGSNLLWDVSYDSAGRVWLGGVTGVGEKKPTTYGTSDEVVSVGVLDNKPIEYRSQVEGLTSGVDYVDSSRSGYVDITPLLDNLPMIKEFRQTRNVQRRNNVTDSPVTASGLSEEQIARITRVRGGIRPTERELYYMGRAKQQGNLHSV